MRAHVEAFLSDVRARPDSPEAGIAYRVCGVTHQFAGDYGEARDNLERALALFQPGRDDDLAFRVGVDVGAAVLLCSAIALWPLGEVERAMSLAESAQARLGGITNAGTLRRDCWACRRRGWRAAHCLCVIAFLIGSCGCAVPQTTRPRQRQTARARERSRR
jgi:hypothetical protein